MISIRMCLQLCSLVLRYEMQEYSALGLSSVAMKSEDKIKMEEPPGVSEKAPVAAVESGTRHKD